MKKKSANKKADTFTPKANGDSRARSPRNGQIAEIIQAWLVLRLCEVLRVKPDNIEVGIPFTSYGLDSLTAFTLTGDLAGWLGHALPATLFWEHPTIEALAQYLSEKVVSQQTAAMLSDSMADIFEEIEGLSEKKAQQGLADKNKQ